jgi:hypothetical protein
MTPALCSSFATTVRVVDGVHTGTANVRPTAFPSHTTCLTPADLAVAPVTNCSNRRSAITWNSADFTTWQGQLRPLTLSGHQRRARTSRTAHGRTGPWTQLNTANRCSDGNVLHWQTVPNDWLGLCPISDLVASFHSVGRNNVSFHTIGILQQRNASRTAWIILNRINDSSDAILGSTEVDNPILLLVPTTTVPRGNLPLVIATARLLPATQERLLGFRTLRQLREVANRRISSSGASRLVYANSHVLLLDYNVVKYSVLQSWQVAASVIT